MTYCAKAWTRQQARCCAIATVLEWRRQTLYSGSFQSGATLTTKALAGADACLINRRAQCQGLPRSSGCEKADHPTAVWQPLAARERRCIKPDKGRTPNPNLCAAWGCPAAGPALRCASCRALFKLTSSGAGGRFCFAGHTPRDVGRFCGCVGNGTDHLPASRLDLARNAACSI